MDRAWPFAIDAVPLQFGSGQITKVTAQFYYTKHKVISHNINGYPRELDPDDPEAGNFGTIPWRSWVLAKLTFQFHKSGKKFPAIFCLKKSLNINMTLE